MPAPTDSEETYRYYIQHTASEGETVYGVIEEKEDRLLTRIVKCSTSRKVGTTVTLTKDDISEGLGTTFDLIEDPDMID